MCFVLSGDLFIPVKIFEIVIWVSMVHPVSFFFLFAHSFLQSSFLFSLIICFTVFMDAVLLWVHSFLFVCLFISWNVYLCGPKSIVVMSMVSAVMTLLILLDSFLIAISLRSSFPSASRTYLASQKWLCCYSDLASAWKYFTCGEEMLLFPLLQLHSWSCGLHKIRRVLPVSRWGVVSSWSL